MTRLRGPLHLAILLAAVIGAFLAATPRGDQQPDGASSAIPTASGSLDSSELFADPGRQSLASGTPAADLRGAPQAERRSRATAAPSASRASGAPWIAPTTHPESPAPSARSSKPRPTPKPTVRPLPAGRAVVRVGLASTYGNGYSERWVALPEGPGWRFTVCGPAGCRTLVSTDAGPDRQMQREGRIVDLPVGAFEDVCGGPWRVIGLCNVSVTILGRMR